MCNVNPSLPIHPAPLVSVFVLFVCELSVFSASALIALRKDFCSHRVFGRGKIVEEVEPGKYRVNFPGLGLKIILADYLTME